MKSTNIPGVYKITNPLNEVYVGSTQTITRRRSSYSTVKNTYNCLLLESYKQYGIKNHSFEIIETFPEGTTKEELVTVEEAYVMQLEDEGIRTLNIMYSENNKSKRSEWGKSIKKPGTGRKGVKPFLNNKVLQLDKKTGKLIREWNNVYEAAETLKINLTVLKRAVQGRAKFNPGGCKWKWKHRQIENEAERPYNNKQRKIIQIDFITKKPLNIFDSIGQAARAVGIQRNNLGQCARGALLSCPHNKYTWKFYDEIDQEEILQLLQLEVDKAMDKKNSVSQELKQKKDNVKSTVKFFKDKLKNGDFDRK